MYNLLVHNVLQLGEGRITDRLVRAAFAKVLLVAGYASPLI